MSKQSRQLAAIMFTDIVGYTALMGEDEAKALNLLDQNRKLQKGFVRKHQGKWLKEMGDGNLLSFPSAIEAVRCAIDIQKAARKTALSNKLRIGIHLGDVTTDNKDVFGEGVNIASRLQALTDPGGVFISEDIQRLIRSHRDVALHYLGEVSLKNVAFPVKIFTIKGPGFPQSKLQVRKKMSQSSIILMILLALILSIGTYWIFDKFTNKHLIRSVAVMPFDNLSGDPDQNYFVEGMTHTLIANLGKVSALRVIWNQSGEQNTESNKAMAAIVGDLGVDAIIDGSVTKEGNQVRITAQMIDAQTEEILWIETYDRDITSILQLHSEVAQAIVDEIQILVTPDEIERLKQAPKVAADAYDSLLKGLYHLYKLSPEDYDIALKYFNAVLEQDSLNAQAYAGIALVWVHKGQWGGEAPLIAAEKAKKVAHRAMELDENLPMAHMAMAHLYTSYYWNWKAAARAYENTIALNPNLSEPRVFYADLLVSLHQNDEALAQIEVAMKVDPLNAFSHSLKGWVLFASRQYEEAIISFNRSLQTDPRNSLSHRCLWSINHSLGNFDLAIKHAVLFYKGQQLEETANDLESKYQEVGYTEAMRYAADSLAERANRKYVSGMRVARLYTFTGDKELALNWLEKAYEEHYVSFFSLNVDPHWESLHDQPRFLDLVKKMNLTLPEL